MLLERRDGHIRGNVALVKARHGFGFGAAGSDQHQLTCLHDVLHTHRDGRFGNDGPFGKKTAVIATCALGQPYNMTTAVKRGARDRKSTRLNSSHVKNLVCRLLLEKKK